MDRIELERFFERLLAESGNARHEPLDQESRAALAAHLTRLRSSEDSARDTITLARLAAWCDGALDAAEAEKFLAGTLREGGDVHELEAAKAFLKGVAAEQEQSTVPPELMATVVAQAQAEATRPVRAKPSRRAASWRWAWAGGAAVAVLSVFVVGELRTDSAMQPISIRGARIASPLLASRESEALLAAPASAYTSLSTRQLAQVETRTLASPSLPPAPAAAAAPQSLGALPESNTLSIARSSVIAGVPLANLTPETIQEEHYPSAAPNPVKETDRDPVSTFSVDVDTASYSNVRRYLTEGDMPPVDAVRVEEMVNYFDYHYTLPQRRSAPFEPTVAVYKTPWNADTQILHIGIKGFDLPRDDRPKANLVFLVDSSGSMNEPNKLPLLKQSFRLLVEQLRPGDKVSIVTYAGAAGLVLPPTSGADKSRILAAMDRLSARGSTAGAEGIRLAYQLAEDNFDKSAVNRVILATDGDFNVGITDPNALEEYIAEKRGTGVFLSVLGFGTGNYNDVVMQKLAQAGNGAAAYIDTLNEAHKVFVDQIAGTLFTIAKDVKIQVEFNPAKVANYRLIGYETRGLQNRDFSNDKVDAGDIGAGHTVTALYEITPVGSKALPTDHLHSGMPRIQHHATTDELATLRIRYKLPTEERSRLITRLVENRDIQRDFAKLPSDVRFAAAVAGAGQLLRHDPYIKSFDYGRVLALAEAAKGDDEFGYRSEFISLIGRMQAVARANIAETTRSADASAHEPVYTAPNPPKPMNPHQVTFADYPPISVRLGEQGTVKVKYLVEADGSVGECEVTASSGSVHLDDAACGMVKRWVFKPATVLDGTPVAMWLDANIAFQLR